MPTAVVNRVTIRPTESEVEVPQTIRLNTSQPCRVKPRMCSPVGAPLLLASKQLSFGGTCVKKLGNSAIAVTSKIRVPEM